jgi:hypothetical protein
MKELRKEERKDEEKAGKRREGTEPLCHKATL